MTDRFPPAIFLMGPTASGKTELAVALVRRLPCEVISVDSAMVYRGMDIGTAKPGPETLAQAPHRLIDIRDPAEPYSAAEFRADALQAMAEISAAGRIPLLVGGTMLYFAALERGLSQLPSADRRVRARLEAEARATGWAGLHRRLREVDPRAAERIHPNDPQRIQRALEVYELTGRPMTELWGEDTAEGLPYTVCKLALAPPRERLHQRVEARFGAMLGNGLLREVERLHARGDLHPGLPSVRAVGYRQLWDHVEGRIGHEAARQRAIAATRRFAKRQLTWLRGESDLAWLDSDAPDLVGRAIASLEEVASRDA